MAADHSTGRDLYTVLGIAPTASDAEIASAYRRLVRDLHPDTRPDHGPVQATRLGEVIAAYEVLGRPDRRAAYDQQSRQALRFPTGSGVAIPVRHRRAPSAGSGPGVTLRAGPVRVEADPRSPGLQAKRPAAEAWPVLDDVVLVLTRLVWRGPI